MVIDTDVVLKKLALPTLRPYVNIAKFGGCVTGLVYAGDMLAATTHNYLAIFIIFTILGYAAWKLARFLSAVDVSGRGGDF